MKLLNTLGNVAALAFWLGVAVWWQALPDAGSSPTELMTRPGAAVQLAVVRQDAGAMAPVSTFLALQGSGSSPSWGGLTLAGSPEDLDMAVTWLDPARIELTGVRLNRLQEIALDPDSGGELLIRWDHE